MKTKTSILVLLFIPALLFAQTEAQVSGPFFQYKEQIPEGEFVTVYCIDDEEIESLSLTFTPKERRGVVIPGYLVIKIGSLFVYAFHVGCASDYLPGKADVSVECVFQDNIVEFNLEMSVVQRDFLSEEISINSDLTDLRTENEELIAEQYRIITSILCSDTICNYGIEKSALKPVDGERISSFYGDRRIYRYSNGSTGYSIHRGIDYAVPVGTPCYAVERGTVVFAGERIITGNTVILQHATGVFSLYYHLDTIAADVGDLLEYGELLGETGATGFATGPHLHWEFRFSGVDVDPNAMMDRPLIDKALILAIIRLYNDNEGGDYHR